MSETMRLEVNIGDGVTIELIAAKGFPSRAKTDAGRNSATVSTDAPGGPMPLATMGVNLDKAWAFLDCTAAQRAKLWLAVQAFDELVASAMGLRRQWFGEGI